MATSAVLTKTVSQIIEEALRDARIIPAEQDVQAIDSARCLTALNNVTKFWQSQGINLWLEEEAVLPLVTGQRSYTLGPNGDNCTTAGDFVSTTLSAAEALGQTILSVTSSTGMTAADFVGIELDDGTRQWTTIVSVDSSTQITVTDTLTAAAASGNTVYAYTTIIPRPVRLLSCRYADTVSGSEIPVNQWSRQEYFNQPDKDSSGTVVQWYYSPQLTDGVLYVWQVASSVNALVRFTYMSPALIYGATTDALNFPEEWFVPLKWAIAAEVGPSYGLNEARQAKLEANAGNTLQQVLSHDVEPDSMYLQPDFS